MEKGWSHLAYIFSLIRVLKIRGKVKLNLNNSNIPGPECMGEPTFCDVWQFRAPVGYTRIHHAGDAWHQAA